MTKSLLSCVLPLALLVSWPIATPASSSEKGLLQPTEYAFGMQLFREGDFYRAISSFKRHAFFTPTASADSCRYMISLCEFEAGRYGEAQTDFARLTELAGHRRLREASAFYEGCCWLNLGQYDAAVAHFEACEFTEPSVQERADFVRGWAELQTGDWLRARSSLQAHVERFPLGETRLLAERIATDLAADPPFGQKSERLGLLLAAIPGGGQCYAGRWGDGIYSILLVGASALMAVRGARDDSDAILSFGSVLTATLYLGSAYGGFSAVRNHNLERWQHALAQYRGAMPAGVFDDPILP